MYTTTLHIGGEEATATGDATFERRNPVSGEVATTAAAATPDDATRAVEAAAGAFGDWAAMGPGERRGLLLAAADNVEARADEFAAAMTAETGATPEWGHFNAEVGASMLREAAALTTMVRGEVIPSNVPGNVAMGVRSPAGVVLGMAPWNAPVILAARAIATPLACGNTVVLKGSETCPETHRLVVEAVTEAGVAPGVLNYVTHATEDAGEVVEAMVAHNAVQRVNFTGSTRVGRIIAQTCAKHLTPVLLELGGKAPLVVLDDADVDDAVNAAAFGSFMHSGQICMSTERIIVDEAIADEFVEKLAAKASALPVGDPAGGGVVLGSVVDQDTVDRCNALVDDAVDKGAEVIAGGRSDDTLVPATLVDRVTPDMDIFHQESFGPVKPITRVRGVDEAVEAANNTTYGLAAAVFGGDLARAWEVAGRIDSGICHVNGPTVHDEAQMPFGGVKDSGWGRFGGTDGIAEFTELRWMTIQTGERHYPF